MTNFEKYKDEIAKIVRNNKFISINKNTRVLGECGSISCYNCRFLGNCAIEALEWLYEEYQEPAPKLTKKERAFCEIVKDGYIARDKNRGLAYHSNLPEYYDSSEYWVPDFSIVKISRQYFNFITCEPGKAWSIKDLLKLEVCDD